MPKPKTPSLFHRPRIVGIRFTAAEYERLELANAARVKQLTPWAAGTHLGTISALIRNQLGPIINPKTAQERTQFTALRDRTKPVKRQRSKPARNRKSRR